MIFMGDAKGIVISGNFDSVCIRTKSGSGLEVGELLIVENNSEKILLQVFDFVYGSQLSQQNLEMASGLKVEENNDLVFFDSSLRNYTLALVKSLALIKNDEVFPCKQLPCFFSEVRSILKNDLFFNNKNPLFFGSLRSGSKVLDVSVNLDGLNVFSHHVLVSGTTGRGKSNFLSNLLWNSLSSNFCGLLVLDPHDEYFGRNKFGLKDHSLARSKLVYYTAKNPPAGARTLKLNISQILPHHFFGVMDWSDAQFELINAYYNEFNSEWIRSVVLEIPLRHSKFNEATLAVVKRRLLQLLGISLDGESVFCHGVFDFSQGSSTISDVVSSLESGCVVIVDTSIFAGSVELLIGSLIASAVFDRYKKFSFSELMSKPVISVVLEEAPRVLGKDVLEKGGNIFSTIAREGRKFKVGLTAITQLPSLIPRDILANMNTKIILGLELKQERQAIIDSAAQDLSKDDRAIASLDKGEAIITSNFAKFALPIKIPNFVDLQNSSYEANTKYDKVYLGVIK